MRPSREGSASTQATKQHWNFPASRVAKDIAEVIVRGHPNAKRPEPAQQIDEFVARIAEI